MPSVIMMGGGVSLHKPHRYLQASLTKFKKQNQ